MGLVEPKRCLNRARAYLRLDPSSEREILSELYTHFEDRVEELKGSGFSEEEAIRIAARDFGSLKAVAGELNEVHSSSNWPQALMSALPHVLFSLLFAFHQWSNLGWLLVILLSVVGVVAYGWRHGRPTWFFTWLGYTLMPLLALGLVILERALSRDNLAASWWLWLAVVVYFFVVGLLCVLIVLRTLKRDWLLGSLTILPLLAVVGWFLTAQWKQELFQSDGGSLSGLEPWIALSFFTLAGLVILFTRLKKRWLKAGVLLAAGFVILTMMASSSGGSIGFPSFVVLLLVALLVLLGPALLDRRIAHQETDQGEDFLERHSCK